MKWVKSGPKRPMPEIPDQARKMLQRVGLTLVVFGLLDISLMIYCLARAAIPTLWLLQYLRRHLGYLSLARPSVVREIDYIGPLVSTLRHSALLCSSCRSSFPAGSWHAWSCACTRSRSLPALWRPSLPIEGVVAFLISVLSGTPSGTGVGDLCHHGIFSGPVLGRAPLRRSAGRRNQHLLDRSFSMAMSRGPSHSQRRRRRRRRRPGYHYFVTRLSSTGDEGRCRGAGVRRSMD